jgi:hypothetical protein
VYESIAQLVEHFTFNERVEGSNPSGLTKITNKKGCKPKGLQPFLFLTASEGFEEKKTVMPFQAC